MMMIAVMAIVAMTASAQNTLRDDGTFTLQPKVGLALGSFSGDCTKAAGESDPKMRTGYEISNFILDIRYNLGLTKVNKVTDIAHICRRYLPPKVDVLGGNSKNLKP